MKGGWDFFNISASSRVLGTSDSLGTEVFAVNDLRMNFATLYTLQHSTNTIGI
jgi:hypothetical protein